MKMVARDDLPETPENRIELMMKMVDSTPKK
jgi:hypothetical protein